MSVFLDPGSSAKIEFGDNNAIDGLTAFTVAITLNLTDTPSGRIAGQWGGGGTGGWLMTITNTDEIGFVVNDGGSAYNGVQTDSVNLASGNIYRIVARLYD